MTLALASGGFGLEAAASSAAFAELNTSPMSQLAAVRTIKVTVVVTGSAALVLIGGIIIKMTIMKVTPTFPINLSVSGDFFSVAGDSFDCSLAFISLMGSFSTIFFESSSGFCCLMES